MIKFRKLFEKWRKVFFTEVDFRTRLGLIFKVVESSIYCYIVQRTIDEVDT